MTGQVRLEISPGMGRFPELVDLICENEGMGLMPPMAGLMTESRSPHPSDWMEALAWLCFEYKDTIHLQLATEPFPNEFPAEDVIQMAGVLKESIENFSEENPDLEYPLDASDEVMVLRRRADTLTHDVTPEDMLSIIQAAQEAGCPRGAITRIVMEVCGNNMRIANMLTTLAPDEWRSCVDVEQARRIIEFAREQGADIHALHILNEAMGYRPMETNLENPERPEGAWEAIEKAGEKARMDYMVTQKALLPL